jgi:hypothetical protein
MKKNHSKAILFSFIFLNFTILTSNVIAEELQGEECVVSSTNHPNGDTSFSNSKNRWFQRGCKKDCGSTCYIKGGHPELPSTPTFSLF